MFYERRPPARLLHSLLAALITLAASLAPTTTVQAQSGGTVTAIYDFDADGGANGISPNPLIAGKDGNFYGTTGTGASGVGEVFKITPGGELTILHPFKGGTDGSYPGYALVQDDAGNLYGSTSGNFSSSLSQVPTIYKLAPDGTLATLHIFDYATTYGGVSAPLLRESDGSLYGVTYPNYDNGADGTIFKLAPDGTFTTLHHFGGAGSVLVYSASMPVRGSDGALYGTTYNGGTNQFSTTYRLAPDGTFTTLHDFGAGSYGPPANGSTRIGGLLLGGDGNFYGLTSTGLFFRLAPDGTVSNVADFDGLQLGAPTSLVRGNDGSLFGSSNDVLFQIDPDGDLSVLYQRGSAGGFIGPVAQAADGSFYGIVPNPVDSEHVFGTIFHLVLDRSVAGVLSFTTLSRRTAPGDGDVILTLHRRGGSQGVVSINYAMVQGVPPYSGLTPAQAGVDYVDAPGTVTWADGDTADKIVTVKMLVPDFNQFDYTRSFSVTLSAPTNGALLGSVPACRILIDHLPAVTSPRTANALVSVPFSYGITINDYHGITGCSATGLPAGLSIGPASVISGTPTTPGVYSVALVVSTNYGDARATLTLTVGSAPLPNAPVLTGPASATATVGSPFAYRLTSSDAAATLTTVGSLPPGLGFDPSAGTLAGTPTQAGNFAVTFNATNAGGTGSLKLALTVAGLPPVPPIPSVTATVTTLSAQFGGGTYGQFTLALSSVQSNDLHVAYSVKGTGLNGTDYVLLKGTAKIKAGKTSKPIKVVPLGDGRGLTKRTVKFTLLSGDGYTVGTAAPLKVKLLAPTP